MPPIMLCRNLQKLFELRGKLIVRKKNLKQQKMKSLNEMFHHDKLVDIEETISSEFAQLESGYYDAKLAVMLSFIIATGIKRLEEIDRHDFPAELKRAIR